MTGSKLIILILTSLTGWTQCQRLNPVHTLDYFCPCEELDECRTVFGGGGNLGHVYRDILQSIPACRKFDEVRCCTKDAMFTAIMIIVNSQENQGSASAPPGSVLAPQDAASTSRFEVSGATGFQAQSRLEQPGLQGQSRNFAGQQPGLQGQSRNFAGQQPDLQGQSRLLPGSGQQAPPLPSGVTGGRLFSLPDVDQRTGPAVQDPPSAFQFPAFPGNPAGVGRSDDDEATRLLGILTSLTGDRSATAGDGSETARALPAGVRCVPFSECTTKKIYGTNPTHFSKFGVISPSRSNCLANSGKILCVTENTGTASVPVVPGHQTSGGHQPSVPAVPNPPVHTPTAPVPSVPGHTPSGPLPAATSPIRPQVSVPLPCVQASACLVVFGTNGDHFTRFGDQQSCPDTSQVRCVTAGGTVTTSRPITTKPPSGGGGVGPVAPSVSIIGPQPIYVSYNNVKGPSVGHDNSLETGGSVQSSGVTGSQQAQINSLLQVLKQRLRSILSG